MPMLSKICRFGGSNKGKIGNKKDKETEPSDRACKSHLE